MIHIRTVRTSCSVPVLYIVRNIRIYIILPNAMLFSAIHCGMSICLWAELAAEIPAKQNFAKQTFENDESRQRDVTSASESTYAWWIQGHVMPSRCGRRCEQSRDVISTDATPRQQLWWNVFCAWCPVFYVWCPGFGSILNFLCPDLEVHVLKLNNAVTRDDVDIHVLKLTNTCWRWPTRSDVMLHGLYCMHIHVCSMLEWSFAATHGRLA